MPDNWGGSRTGSGRKSYSELKHARERLKAAITDDQWHAAYQRIYAILMNADPDGRPITPRESLAAGNLLFRLDYALMPSAEEEKQANEEEPIKLIEVHRSCERDCPVHPEYHPHAPHDDDPDGRPSPIPSPVAPPPIAAAWRTPEPPAETHDSEPLTPAAPPSPQFQVPQSPTESAATGSSIQNLEAESKIPEMADPRNEVEGTKWRGRRSRELCGTKSRSAVADPRSVAEGTEISPSLRDKIQNPPSFPEPFWQPLPPGLPYDHVPLSELGLAPGHYLTPNGCLLIVQAPADSAAVGTSVPGKTTYTIIPPPAPPKRPRPLPTRRAVPRRIQIERQARRRLANQSPGPGS